ncbi:MAG: WhiB family transcriptional regulator [Galactobacter sp.]|uniref:WhiB family transcriptional regulator n=1 Tax=Galactobacter sp. TaxID=2676125 RepID=UPI0025C2D403|nr:WhiB family transcriptional regulator [Galactobacter sp.]
MGNSERNGAERASAPARASRTPRVPQDWFLDPVDPEAAERYDSASLEDAATAFLSSHARPHELQDRIAPVTDLPTPEDDTDDSEDELFEAQSPQKVWIPLEGFLSEQEEGELGWQTEALCAQTDPEAFFPEKGGSTRDAKKVCSSCTVRQECLDYALDNDERFGIWGGLSERERRRLRKRAN